MRYTVSKTAGPYGLGGSTPSPSASHSGVVELARRAVVTREIAGSIPAAGARTHLMPPWSNGMTPDSQSGSCGLNSRRGCCSTGCRGAGHPADFGRRRPQVRLLPARSLRVGAMKKHIAPTLRSILSPRYARILKLEPTVPGDPPPVKQE